MSSSGRPINPMTGQSNHGTFRKNGSGRLQWLFSFRFGVSVFGCVILFSLIILAMVLQRLRDEAHRFAIETHRARRSKNLLRSEIDGIPSVGAQRKRLLLHHFGSAKAVSRAGLEDLEQVDGISVRLAKIIYDYFHETS